MSPLHVVDGQVGRAVRALLELGGNLVKNADSEIAYSLAGALYLSSSGFLLLNVPNAVVRGVFAAMTEPGIQLPPAGPDGNLNAHITVMRPEEIEAAGGPDTITERGKQFRYTLGRLYETEPDGWPGVSKVWYIKVHSPELQALRRSYGLPSLPNGGRYEFHITVAIRRKGVLCRSETTKTTQA